MFLHATVELKKKKKSITLFPVRKGWKGQWLDNFCTTDKKYAFRTENEQILKLSLVMLQQGQCHRRQERLSNSYRLKASKEHDDQRH